MIAHTGTPVSFSRHSARPAFTGYGSACSRSSTARRAADLLSCTYAMIASQIFVRNQAREGSSGCRAYLGVSGTKTAPRTGLANSLARQSM
jgi:hypothetical protein